MNWNWVFIFLFVTQKKHTDCIHNFGDVKAWTFGIWRDSGTSTTLLHAQPLTRLLLRLMCSVETSLPFNNTLTWEQSAGHTIFCTSLNLPPLGEFFAERGCLFSGFTPHAGRVLHVSCHAAQLLQKLWVTKPTVYKRPRPSQLTISSKALT